MQNVKKTNGKLELHVVLPSFNEVANNKADAARVTSDYAYQILLKQGHLPGSPAGPNLELRNDIEGRRTEGVFIFKDLSVKEKPAVKITTKKTSKPAAKVQKKED